MKTIVIGVGNEYRGDDGAGRMVARRLVDQLPDDIDVKEASGESAGLMEMWHGYDRVYLVDAVDSRQPAGTVHRIAANEETLPRDFFHCSTHAFSIAEAVELARSLELLPPELIVYGIEGKWFESSQRLTPEVAAAVDLVSDRILNELKKG